MSDKIDKDFSFFKSCIKVNDKQLEKIYKYIEILDYYQNNMNLIGKSTRINIWSRHILDSAQILKLLPKQNRNDFIIDVGTGAGFPGIILSIMDRRDIILCEKSIKKINFLNIVSKECKLKIKIFKGKIENYNNKNIKVIVSRAFSPLKTLFIKVKHITNRDTVFVLHKGKKYINEMEEAKKYYRFSTDCYNSLTSPLSRILKIKNVVNVHG